jgi:hypothetical protein
VINLQRRTDSNAAEIPFTINLGVAIERLPDRAHNWSVGKRPLEYRCHFRRRLGWLMAGMDTRWSLTPDTNTVALADTTNTALEAYGFPWLEARSNEDRLLDIVRDAERHEAETYPDLVWLAEIAEQRGTGDLHAWAQAVKARKWGEVERLRAASSAARAS